MRTIPQQWTFITITGDAGKLGELMHLPGPHNHSLVTEDGRLHATFRVSATDLPEPNKRLLLGKLNSGKYALLCNHRRQGTGIWEMVVVVISADSGVVTLRNAIAVEVAINHNGSCKATQKDWGALTILPKRFQTKSE